MPIKGNLERIDLANIFQMLTLNQNVGTLHIYYGDVHKEIYFNGSGVILPYDQDIMEDRVISLLVRQGRLTEEQVERARYNVNTLNTGLLGAILQMNFTTEAEVQTAMRHHMEEEIYDLFLVKNAVFEFVEDEKPGGARTLDERFVLSPSNLLMEAVRRGDEWAHIRELVPSEREVFEVIDASLPEGVDDPEGEYPLVFEALDGVRSVQSVIQVTRLHRFSVFKKCSVLVEAGKIAPVNLEDLLERADRCIQGGRTRDAIDLYERAVAAGIRDAAVFEKVYQAYLSEGEHRKALAHLYRLSEIHENRGALKDAIRVYRTIREIMPTELVARERIFQLFLYNQELFEEVPYDAFQEGKVLALILKEVGRVDEAEEILQLLVEAYRGNDVALEDLAKVALEIRRPHMAIRILEHLGERLEEGRNMGDALRIYRRIKCIDPDHRGIDDRLDRLMEDDLAARNRRARVLKTVLLLSLLLFLIGLYCLFNVFASRAYTSIDFDDLMASGRYGEAQKRYESFCARFPLSIYWLLAREKLSVVRNAMKHSRYEEELRRKFEKEERFTSQREAEGLFENGEESFRARDLVKALRLYKKAVAAASDPVWASRVGLETKIQEIVTYCNAAEALRKEAETLRKAGKFAEAHGLLSKLWGEYGDAPAVEGITLPVLVTSDPPGARITFTAVNDEEAREGGGGKMEQRVVTPAVVDLPPHATFHVRVEKEGFAVEKRTFTPLDAPELAFPLRLEAEKRLAAGKGLAYPPLRAGKGLLLAFKDGRIKYLPGGAPDGGWLYTVKELQNLEAAPAVAGERACFCWGGDRITALELADGLPRWEKRLPGAAAGAPLAVGGAIFVPLDGGRIAGLEQESGEIRLEADLGGKITLELLPWEQGVIAALEDGRILWVEGKKGKVLFERRLAVRPTAWFAGGDVVHVGDAQGGLHGYRRRNGEVDYNYDTDRGEAVTAIRAYGSKVYLLTGDRCLLLLDKERLRMIGRFESGGPLFPGPPPRGDTFTVGGGDTTLYLFRAADLTPIHKYRAGGPVVFPGVDMEGYACFYAADGILYGVRN